MRNVPLVRASFEAPGFTNGAESTLAAASMGEDASARLPGKFILRPSLRGAPLAPPAPPAADAAPKPAGRAREASRTSASAPAAAARTTGEASSRARVQSCVSDSKRSAT